MDVRLSVYDHRNTTVLTNHRSSTTSAMMNDQSDTQAGLVLISTTLTLITTVSIKQELMDNGTRDLLLEITNCYLLPFVFVFGLIGNTLSLIVLICKIKSMTTSTILLVGLTISDLGYLVTTFMRKSSCLATKIDAVRGPWMDAIFLPQVYMLNRVFGLVTAFITMVIAIERCLAVYFPLKVGLIVTKPRIKLVVVAVYTVSSGLLSPFFFIYEVWWTPGGAQGGGPLVPKVRETRFFKDHRQGLTIYNNIVLSNVLVFLPIVVVCACSVMVVDRTSQSLRWRMSVQRPDEIGNQTKSQSSAKQLEKDTIYTLASDSSQEFSQSCQVLHVRDPNSSLEFKDKINNTNLFANDLKKQQIFQRKRPIKKHLNSPVEGNKKMTKMLLIISISYVICNVPTSIATVANLVEPNFASFSGHYTNVFLVVSGFNILLQCVNSSFNFVIYVANSSRLGASFRRMLTYPFNLSKK